MRVFRVARPPALRFRAGQYLRVGVAGHRSRKYSLASAPHEPHLELCIERVPGGRLTPHLFGLAPGARLELGARASGRFRLDESGPVHVMVATVTGIAPLRSMLLDALHRGVGEEFLVLHGASHADELPYHDELVALMGADPRVRYVPTVSRPAEPRSRGWTGRTGRVDALALQMAAMLDRRRTRVYACGNAAMVANVAEELTARGFAVSTESFD